MTSFLLLTLALHATGASTLSTRTWVSAVGDDTYPCTRAQPCRTFPAAFAVTASGGTVDVLDFGSFGGITINKPITIEATGAQGGIGVSAGNGITINTSGANDTVVLRGLSLDGLGSAAAGIRVYAVGKLVIERCTIQNFTTHGLDYESTTSPSYLLISDSTINANVGMNGTSSGLYLTTSFANAVLDRVRIVHNGIGVQVRAGAASMRDSAISGNSQANVKVVAAGTARVAIDGTLVSDSVGGTGIAAQGFGANVWLSNSTVTGNNTGLSVLSGSINSFGNNRIFGNMFDGSVTTTPMQQ